MILVKHTLAHNGWDELFGATQLSRSRLEDDRLFRLLLSSRHIATRRSVYCVAVCGFNNNRREQVEEAWEREAVRRIDSYDYLCSVVDYARHRRRVMVSRILGSYPLLPQ